MVQQPQKIIRVKFEKTGKLQYISHLDLLRTMQTALRRAKVKMIYSEGFNPHMKITFALPLSIGTESLCEYMDIRTQPDV
ncbi:MAG: TIGR03936 family radical SAM-associated protein, partial [Clostridia bacterium]|nr:TIGR03936 family radical SAM-associated protein [Clostridia bacterium]